MEQAIDEIKGLSSSQVEAARAAGDVNVTTSGKSRSVRSILRDNVCTLFNLLNVVLFAFVLITGSFKNGLFMGVIICNTAIGIIQELRSKKLVDELSIVASSNARVIRDGVECEVAQDELVRGDLVVLGRGDQVPCDATVVDGTANADESLLTGESNLIPKGKGSPLMSGSFVSSGRIVARIDHVGDENYAAKISAEAKAQKDINSEIMTSLNKIIKFVSIIIVPVGILLFASMFWANGIGFTESILSTVAALVGMVPEGLILLTSSVLALAVIRLSRRNVLVQQLFCIETLAHVDTLCLDKTGTITSGAMEVAGFDAIAGGVDVPNDELASALVSVAAADPDSNETGKAIRAWGDQLGIEPVSASSYVPFSSERKWSGALFDARGEKGSLPLSSEGADVGAVAGYVMGAAQFVLKDGYDAIAEQVEQRAAQARVLVLARVAGFDGEAIVGEPEPLALVMIRDQIRSSAAETIGYFRAQGVDVKVISGDDPRTVSGIAAQVGVPNAENYVDATTLSDDDAIADAAERYSVFGRVKPEQKKALVVALQQKGHTVAMTGDGVNDTLALKQADCSVAMAAGSDAARNVAQLVLVDNDFASMPEVVAEGRRSINNLQRSSSLFLVKTIYSAVLAVLFILLPWQYPFEPIQMTLVGSFTIGIPSLVLALEPNFERIKGSFLENVTVTSIPGAAAMTLAVLAACAFGYLELGLDSSQVATVCTVLCAIVGANLVLRISLPPTPLRIALWVVVIGGVVGGIALFPNLFAISPFTHDMWIALAVIGVTSILVFNILFDVFKRWHDQNLALLV